MEPRAFARGNTRLIGPRENLIPASMEPRACARGNLGLEDGLETLRKTLQWSHALARVETYQLDGRRAANNSASMEPRACARGNRSSTYRSTAQGFASMEP